MKKGSSKLSGIMCLFPKAGIKAGPCLKDACGFQSGTSCSFLPVLQRVPLALQLSLNRCSRVPKSFVYVFYHFHMLSSSILIFFTEALESTSLSHFSHCYNKDPTNHLTEGKVHHFGLSPSWWWQPEWSAVITAAAWLIFCVHTFKCRLNPGPLTC